MTKMLSNTRDYSCEYFMVSRSIDGILSRGQMTGRSIGMVFASFARRDDIKVAFNDQGIDVVFNDGRFVTYHVGGRHHCAWNTGTHHAPLLRVWSRILRNQDVMKSADRALV